MPGGKIGGEEKGGEKDRPDQRGARPADRLAYHQCNQEKEGQGDRHPPEAGGHGSDPGVTDEKRTGGERHIAEQQRDERPAVRG